MKESDPSILNARLKNLRQDFEDHKNHQDKNDENILRVILEMQTDIKNLKEENEKIKTAYSDLKLQQKRQGDIISKLSKDVDRLMTIVPS